jgi:hypothetical protein
MKNKPFLIVLLLLISGSLIAQDSKFRLGIRFAPGLSSNRVTDVDEKDLLSFDNNKSGIRFSAGLTGDFYFGKNYSFYTGLWYTVYRVGVSYSGSDTLAGFSGESIHNMQHVQIPVALKLFTNEVATDTKLYFVLGGTLGAKINEKEKEWVTNKNTGKPDALKVSESSKGKAYSFGDIGLLLGMGLEYQMGESTRLFGGLSYNRGLLNVASKKGPFWVRERDAEGYYNVSISLISLEAGIKF